MKLFIVGTTANEGANVEQPQENAASEKQEVATAVPQFGGRQVRNSSFLLQPLLFHFV